MVIGIIGSGNMGKSVGAALVRADHEVRFSFVRDFEALQRWTDALGQKARAVAPRQMAEADVLFLACPYSALNTALSESGALAGRLDGKPLITCVSGLRPDFTGARIGLPTDRAMSVAEEIATCLPGVRVVEAFNTTFAEVIARGPDFDGTVASDAPRPTLFYCGDDPYAKSLTARLIRDCGFEPIDAGALSVARSQETLATVWVQFAVTAGLFPGITLRVLRG